MAVPHHHMNCKDGSVCMPLLSAHAHEACRVKYVLYLLCPRFNRKPRARMHARAQMELGYSMTRTFPPCVRDMNKK